MRNEENVIPGPFEYLMYDQSVICLIFISVCRKDISYIEINMLALILFGFSFRVIYDILLTGNIPLIMIWGK